MTSMRRQMHADSGFSRRRAWLTGLALVAVGLAVVASVALYLARLGWGLDRTDEGQYLLLLAHPEDSRATVFLFGYVLHPVFAVLGGSIVGMRWVGALVSMALAGLVGFTASRVTGVGRICTLMTSAVAAAFGLAPMLYFPLTPSYNTLAFWGVCVWAIGLLLAASPTHAPGRLSMVAGALLGVGGVAASAGKATTGAALAVLTLLVVVAVRRGGTARIIIGTVAGALFGLIALLLLVGHGPVWLVDFYREGARSVALLEGHEHVVRLDPFDVSAMVFAAPTTSPVTMLAMWWLPVLLVVAGVTRRAPLARSTWLTVAILALLPLAYVVGTNGNYWIAQSRASLFWLVAGVLVVGGRPRPRWVFTAAAAALLLVVTGLSLGHGYRYPGARHVVDDPADVASAVVSPEGARLALTAEDARTSRELARTTQQFGLVGMPMLDVTGASPGYIRQLGGRPVGSSWLLGGYSGSERAAVSAVRAEDPGVVARAWVLDAPEWRRRIGGLLPALGRSVERDYEVVMTFRHHLGYNVQLLRPRDSARQ